MGRTKVRIQRGENGIVMLVDHGYKQNEEDTETHKELLVFEDPDNCGDDSTEAFQAMVWSLKENLGYGTWDKYAERNLHLIERPGDDFSSPIQDDEYLKSLADNAYSFLAALHGQKQAFKQEKEKFPDIFNKDYGMTKQKLDKILKILFTDDE